MPNHADLGSAGCSVRVFRSTMVMPAPRLQYRKSSLPCYGTAIPSRRENASPMIADFLGEAVNREIVLWLTL